MALDGPALLQPLTRPLFDHAPSAAGLRVALVTCAALPDLDDDDRRVLAPLARVGVVVEPVVWDDPAVDWAGYDLAVLRSTWDYPGRRDEFLAWSRRVPRLANPAEVVAWNTDKRYLGELSAAGVPVVPTRWLAPGDAWLAPDGGEWVIKPAVSVGSLDTGRYDLAGPAHRRLAVDHVARLQAAGRLLMVQPYLDGVDTSGETAMVFIGGEYSHAIRKGPMLDGPDRAETGLYKEERITPREPTAAEHAAAAMALAAVAETAAVAYADAAPGAADRLLYARVDLIPGDDGEPLVVEVELTEPSLFLAFAEGAADRLARAIVRAARAPR